MVLKRQNEDRVWKLAVASALVARTSCGLCLGPNCSWAPWCESVLLSAWPRFLGLPWHVWTHEQLRTCSGKRAHGQQWCVYPAGWVVLFHLGLICCCLQQSCVQTVLLIFTGSGRGPCSCPQIIHQQFSLVHTGHLQVGKAALQPLKLCSFAPVEGPAHSKVQESNIQYN